WRAGRLSRAGSRWTDPGRWEVARSAGAYLARMAHVRDAPRPRERRAVEFRVPVPHDSRHHSLSVPRRRARGIQLSLCVRRIQGGTCAGSWRVLMRRIREHLTYANVCASLALFIALGGTSYAAFSLPRDSVGERELRARSVGTSELKASAVTSRNVRDGSIAPRDLSATARSALAGPPGPQGVAGQTGATGSKGERGPQGAAG